MLSPAEEFWLRWLAEHGTAEVAERASRLLRTDGPQTAVPGGGPTGLKEFSRPELKPEQLLRLFPAQVAHGEYAARLAGQLFDSTRALHNLPFKSRRLLLTAALLRPLAASQNGHAGLDLLDYPKLAGLGGRQQAAVACLIKLQRKGYRADRDLQFKKLRPNLQKQMRPLAALLQAAEALDTSRTQTTALVAADLRPEGVSLRASGPRAIEDTSALIQNTWLWRGVFNHALKAVVVPQAEAAQAPPAATLPHPDQPMAAAIQRALAACLQVWQTSQPAALEGDLAAQSRLEDAINQLRAGLAAFRSLLKRKPVDALTPALRALQQAADEAAWRETAAADIASFRARLAADKANGLEPLQTAWESARRQQQAELKRILGGPDAAELYAQLVEFSNAPPVRKHGEGDVRSTARPLLSDLIDRLTEREAAVTVQRPKTLKRYRQALVGLAVALESLGGAAILGEPAAQLLADLGRFQNRLDRLRLSLQFDAAIGEFLDTWAEKQARDKTPQLFGAQTVLAYRQARKAQWARLRRSLSHDWRPVRANRLRRQLDALLRTLESS
jgi:inorganic triphosphatase YgiF